MNINYLKIVSHCLSQLLIIVVLSFSVKSAPTNLLPSHNLNKILEPINFPEHYLKPDATQVVLPGLETEFIDSNFDNNGMIASVSASSGSTVNVIVGDITGSGIIKLNLNAATNIADVAGNAGPAAYTNGTTHAVAIPVNTAPVISNLNGDSLPWPGVGNLAVLDVGGNATITDNELDASNWNGASLSVQRANIPLVSDVFGFNPSGYAVIGNSLQVGGTTFGTFINANGILTITFNANATNPQVHDVISSIQYRNDTPAGDAVIRFTLSDGNLSATADVIVTSDFIYVDNYNDTGIINLSDGVSFSEAVAIAAANVTGSQTLIFTKALASPRINLVGNLSMNESLMINADAAPGIVIAGGTITLGTGTTLSFTNSSGSTANVSSVIAGAGSLAKFGAGVLVLNSGGSNTYSGATTVAEGGLTLRGINAIGNNSSVTVASGATLTLAGVNETIGSLAGSGSVVLGDIFSGYDLTTGDATSTTFTGSITGKGGLTKTGSGIFTLESGSNTYSGATTVAEGGLTLIGGNAIGDMSAVTVATGTTLTLAGGQETIGSLAGSGNVVLSYTLNTGENNTNTIFSGVISSVGNNGIAKRGTGIFVLSGTNTYTGSTTVSAGTLALNGGEAISDVSAVTVASGATLSLGANETIGPLAGAGNVSLNSFTLSSGGYNASTTTFSGSLSGSGGFIKIGSDTLILSGSNSGSFSGGMTVFGGTLSVASDDNLGAGTLSINQSILEITGSSIIDNYVVLTDRATIENAKSATLSGVISGNGSLNKIGSGKLTLAGTSTYVDITSVTAGSLSVTGALNGTPSVIVYPGATIMGTGSVTSLTVLTGGTLSPGDGLGGLTVDGNLRMSSGSTLAIDINGTTAGTDYDQVIVFGTVSIAGNVVVTHGYSGGNGDIYTIIDNDMADAITGNFSGLAEGATITAGGNGTKLTASYMGGTGNDFTLTAPINAAPVIANLNGNSVNFIEDVAYVLLDAGNDATLTDGDSMDLDGGNVTVSIVANRINAEDVLSIQNQGIAGGQVGTSGLNLTYGGTIIGTRTANGGTDAHDFVITLNSAATPAIAQALVRNLIYINTNTTNPNTAVRTVRVTVNDGDGGTSSPADVEVTVIEVNDPPILTATGGTPIFTEGDVGVSLFRAVSISTVEPGQLIKTLAFTISNVTNGSSEVMTIDGSAIQLTNGFSATTINNAINASVAVVGTTATVTLFNIAGISVAAAQTLVDEMTYSNSSNNPGVANRVVTIRSLEDTGGITNGGVDRGVPSVSATVTIIAVNDEPTISMATALTHINQGEFYEYTPIVNDPDGDVLLFDGVNLPGWIAIDPLTGRIYGTPDNNDVGTHPFESFIRVSDDNGVNWYWTESDFFFTVVNVNDAPTITGSPAATIRPGETYRFEPSAEDIDGDQLSFSILNKPNWASFNTTTGVLTGTPLRKDEGLTSSILISVSDGTVSIALPAFTINVEPAQAITGITFDDASFVYDGTVQSLAIIGTLPVGASVSYADNDRTDVGTQTVTATIDGGANYENLSLTAALTISKAVITDITFDDISVVYDGTAKSLAIVGTLPVGASVSYVDNDRTDAGTQTVTANIDGGANYENLNLTAELTISKAVAAISGAAIQTHVYDGAVKNVQASLNHTETALSYNPQQGYSEAGKYTIQVSAIETPNYLPARIDVQLIIDQVDLRGVVFKDKTVSYTGQAYLLEVDNLPEGWQVSYEGNRQVDAGNYAVMAKITHSGYPEKILTANLVIAKASQRISFQEIGTVARDVGRSALLASSSSGLPLSFTSDDPFVATIEGHDLLIHRLGTVRVTAAQAGDKNHEGAEPVGITVVVVDEDEGPVKVSKAVSPNGDGVNDFLILEGIKAYPDNRFQILSRNGLLLFDLEEYDNETKVFKGQSNTRAFSETLPEGTYFYSLKFRDGNKWKTKKGWFVLKVKY